MAKQKLDFDWPDTKGLKRLRNRIMESNKKVWETHQDDLLSEMTEGRPAVTKKPKHQIKIVKKRKIILED